MHARVHYMKYKPIKMSQIYKIPRIVYSLCRELVADIFCRSFMNNLLSPTTSLCFPSHPMLEFSGFL